jgi:Uncharacterized protein with SCP/PR1 domains
MSENNFFSHTSQNGDSVGDRVTEEGYSYARVAENIAQGQSSYSVALDAWMGSSGHRANLLNPDFKNIGISSYNRYYVQNFGTLLLGDEDLIICSEIINNPPVSLPTASPTKTESLPVLSPTPFPTRQISPTPFPSSNPTRSRRDGEANGASYQELSSLSFFINFILLYFLFE